MKFNVDHIKDAPHSIHFDEPVSTFPLLAEMQQEAGCRITGVITGDVTVTREFDTIRVSGRVSAPLKLACSRCLVDYDSFVDTGFTLFFRKGVAPAPAHDEEIELGEADLLSSAYTGDEIDLTHEIEEQVAMEIPLKPLCSDDCKGLCHDCGIDLNISGCGCSTEPVHLTFSALKNFKVDRK